jgi:hypothetical protein
MPGCNPYTVRLAVTLFIYRAQLAGCLRCLCNPYSACSKHVEQDQQCLLLLLSLHLSASSAGCFKQTQRLRACLCHLLTKQGQVEMATGLGTADAATE